MAFKTMKQKIKKGSILILYNKDKPKIQGICVATFDKYCVLRSLQSGYDYKVFYSNKYLKVAKVEDIDFSFLRFLDVRFRLDGINTKVFEKILKNM